MKRAWILLVISCGSPPASVAIPAAPPAASSSAALAAPRAGSNVRVRFTGLVEVKEAELAKIVEIDKPEKNPGATNRDVLERDVLFLQAALYDRGYVESKIQAPRVDIGADGVIDVTFAIEEGARYKTGSIAVVDTNGAALAKMEHARSGEWFSRRVLVDDIAAITKVYRDAAYGKVDVLPETELDRAAHVLSLKVVITRGPIVTLRNVITDPPQSAIALDAANRAGVTSGARFSETKLETVKRDLTAKGIRTDVAIRDTPQPDVVDVSIELH